MQNSERGFYELCEQYNEAKKELDEAQIVVINKLSDIGRGISMENPTEEELVRSENAHNRERELYKELLSYPHRSLKNLK